MRGKKRTPLFALIVTVIFAGVGVLLIMSHEPIPNEVYSVFSHLGLSYAAGSYISLALVSVAVFLLCTFSRFSKWQKVLITLSSGFLYFPYVHSGFGLGTFFPGAKMDYLEFSKQLNESLFGMLIPIFELGLAFLLIYLWARYLKLFFAALLSFGLYLSALYFFAPPSLSGEMTAPLIALAVFFIALTFSGKRRGKNRLDQIIGRMETYKLIKDRVSVRSLCLIFIFLSVPNAVFASIHDLTSPVSDTKVIADIFNELPENSVILPASAQISYAFEPYAQLLSHGRELYKDVVTDGNLAELSEKLAGRNIYIIYETNACGNSINEITIDGAWDVANLLDETKNALLERASADSLVRATGLEPAQLKIATTTSR